MALTFNRVAMPNTERALRWGIAGSGKICSDFCTALKGNPENHQVAGVAARSLQTSSEFARKFNIPHAYGSYQELATQLDLDVIYIGVINTCHYELCKGLLEAGKSILCEKPMTLTHKQTLELVEMAREKNVFMMEGYWTRFFPCYKQMLSDIEAGTIGDVKTLTVELGLNIIGNERIQNLSMGGGILVDLGGYAIQLACSVFKEYPLKITSSGALYHTGVDLYETIYLQYSNDRFAVLTLHAGVQMKNRATIYGTKGSMEMPEFWHPAELITNSTSREFPLPQPAGEMNFGSSEGMLYEGDHVRQCILEGKTESSMMPLSASLDVVKILDEVRSQIGVVWPFENN